MTYTDENGRLYVVDEDDDRNSGLCQISSGGVLHCMIRCADEATFEAAGLQVGLLQYENPAAGRCG